MFSKESPIMGFVLHDADETQLDYDYHKLIDKDGMILIRRVDKAGTEVRFKLTEWGGGEQGWTDRYSHEDYGNIAQTN